MVSGDLKFGTLLKVRGISVSIIKIERSLVFASALRLISMLSFLRSFISFCTRVSDSPILSNFMMCCLGTWPPLSII